MGRRFLGVGSRQGACGALVGASNVELVCAVPTASSTCTGGSTRAMASSGPRGGMGGQGLDVGPSPRAPATSGESACCVGPHTVEAGSPSSQAFERGHARLPSRACWMLRLAAKRFQRIDGSEGMHWVGLRPSGAERSSARRSGPWTGRCRDPRLPMHVIRPTKPGFTSLGRAICGREWSLHKRSRHHGQSPELRSSRDAPPSCRASARNGQTGPTAGEEAAAGGTEPTQCLEISLPRVAL